MRIETINPATEEVTGSYETQALPEVMAIAARVQAAAAGWRALGVAGRARGLRGLARVLRRNAETYAGLITVEMGKPIRESRAEIEKCAWLCEVYTEHAGAWLEDEAVAADGRQHLVTLEPLGVILAIMPWNFPFWQALRFAVPTLLAGNTSVLKHASSVPQCARAIEEAFLEAGVARDVLRVVFADHAAIATLIASDIVQGISLTGSTTAGARVAELAGRHLKKTVLELGGSDPFLVLADADIESAARQAVKGRMIVTGQSCIAAKRFIIAEEIAAAFTDRLVSEMEALVVGDPLDERTQVGPLANAEALHLLQAQLADALAQGAILRTGGQRLEQRGLFFPPTVVTDVTLAMRLMREEVFGPIAPVLCVSGEEEALRAANATAFGLGGSVWTRDLARGLRVARRLEAGTTFINGIVKSDPRMPFGGIKQSGYGRELSHYGLREFVNVKGINVYTAESSPGREPPG